MSAKCSADGDATAIELPPSVFPNLFELLDAAGPTYGLVGGYCPSCARHSFPLTERCCACRGELARTIIGHQGTVYSYTVVRTKAPFGLPEPYAVGYVDLAETSLRVFSLLDPEDIDGLAVGAPVQLVVKTIGVDAAGRTCLRPMFSVVDAVSTRTPR